MTWFLTTRGIFFCCLLFLTLAPRDCVIYCSARGLTGHTSPCGECAFFILGLRPRTSCLLGWSFTILLLWTLAPHDYAIYCQARRLSGHTSPFDGCVCFNLEDSAPPEVEEDYLPFSWSDSKWAHLVHCEEIFYFELELLTSIWKPYLGYSARRWFTIARRLIMLVGL